MRCEDFPCCGHESGCCPSFDPETGEQTDMRCTCGASVPITSQYSICAGCLATGTDETGDRFGGYDDSPESYDFDDADRD